jgi:hypothetical protein
MKWYYESNGHPQGPILESELLELKEEGKIGGTCLVWREGMEDWAPLEKVREFGPAPKMGAFGELRLPSLQKEVSSATADFSPVNSAKEGPARFEHASQAAASRPTSEEAPSETHNLPEARPTDGEAGTCPSGWAPKWENPGPAGPLPEFLPSVVFAYTVLTFQKHFTKNFDDRVRELVR